MTGAVLVLGVQSEPPIVGVREALERLEIPHLAVDQRDLAGGEWETWIAQGAVGGRLSVPQGDVELERFSGVYTRMASWATVLGDDLEAIGAERVHDLHQRVDAWLETTPARVANRTKANDTNNSKPLQAMLLRDYFHVPATLVTNDAAEVVAFRDAVGPLIYKSCSGERSIVTELSDRDLPRLELLTTVPVQFQEKLDGTDVRVHVVGESVFPTAIASDATDYRYDDSGESEMHPVEVADEVAAACVALTARLGLEISGIDLRFCTDGRICCFEVNPSPAYIVYEDATGQPISEALARHLAG